MKAKRYILALDQGTTSSRAVLFDREGTPVAMAQRLREAGAIFRDWRAAKDGRVLARLATSFATPDEDVTKLLDVARA